VKRSIKLGMMAAAVCGVAIAVAALGSTKATAATATASLSVTATVSNNCTISTVAVAFGNYDPVGANASTNLDGTGTVVVACTKGATATVALGNGNNASGSVRRMSDGASNFLSYELYNEATRTTVWNSGAGLLATGAAPSKAARNFTVYGRVASDQDVPAGNYSDTVVATVNF
jgi:spore coat protein U-like protein